MTEEAQYKQIDKFVIFYQMILGKGAYWEVFLGAHLEDENKLVAAKVVQKRNLSKNLKELQKKIKNFKIVSSQFIVNLHDVLQTQNNLYMLHEYCYDGDLLEYLKKKERRYLSEQESLTFLRHIVEGFKAFKKQNIIHKHIKLGSIMLSCGIAKINLENFFVDYIDDYLNINCRVEVPYYCSLQMIEQSPFTDKCDIWSVGVALFQMLYGTIPWAGNSIFYFYKNIKTIPLTFPITPIRSNEIKELLACMLKIKEEERISWEDLFNHSLIKDSNTNVDSHPQFPPENSLELSIKQNQKYLKENLVAGYLKTIHQIKEENQKAKTKCSNKSSSKSQVANQWSDSKPSSERVSSTDEQKQKRVTDIFNKLKKSKQARKNILQVNEYVLYERNIAFFFNFTIQRLIQAYDSGKLEVSSDMYFRILLSMCKQQVIQLDKMRVFMSQGESTQFDDNYWQLYQESNEYEITSDLIHRDLDHSKKLYEELSKKAKEVIDHSVDVVTDPERQQILNRFLSVIDNSFILDSKFKFIFKSTLNELIKILLPVVFVQTPNKEVLLIVHFLYFCVNPYLEFKSSSFDFWRFYEETENFDEKSILEIILQKLDYL